MLYCGSSAGPWPASIPTLAPTIASSPNSAVAQLPALPLPPTSAAVAAAAAGAAALAAGRWWGLGARNVSALAQRAPQGTPPPRWGRMERHGLSLIYA